MIRLQIMSELQVLQRQKEPKKFKEIIISEPKLGEDSVYAEEFHRDFTTTNCSKRSLLVEDSIKIAREIAQKFCLDNEVPYRHFDIFVSDNLSGTSDGGVKIVCDFENGMCNSYYIMIDYYYCLRTPEVLIANTLLHELLGHAMLETHKIKVSPKLLTWNNGLEFQKTNRANGNVKTIGGQLKELLTEYIADTEVLRYYTNELTTEQIVLVSTDYLESEIKDLELLFSSLMKANKIEGMDKIKFAQEFYACLVKAKITGSPWIIMRFIREKTKAIDPNGKGFAIKPKDLFNLNFQELFDFVTKNEEN